MISCFRSVTVRNGVSKVANTVMSLYSADEEHKVRYAPDGPPGLENNAPCGDSNSFG